MLTANSAIESVEGLCRARILTEETNHFARVCMRPQSLVGTIVDQQVAKYALYGAAVLEAHLLTKAMDWERTLIAVELYQECFKEKIRVYFVQLDVMQTRGMEERVRMRLRQEEHEEAVGVRRLMVLNKWRAIEGLQRRATEELAAKGMLAIITAQEEALRTLVVVHRIRQLHNSIGQFWATTRLDEVSLVDSMPPEFAAAVDELLVVIAHGMAAPCEKELESSPWHRALVRCGYAATLAVDALDTLPLGSDAPPVLLGNAAKVTPTTAAGSRSAAGRAANAANSAGAPVLPRTA
jgi:hypothetical protein